MLADLQNMNRLRLNGLRLIRFNSFLILSYIFATE